MATAISPASSGLGVDASTTSASAVSPEERLLALVVYTQTSQLNGAKTDINLNAEQLEKLRDQVKKALDEAREAKKDSGFWGGLAKLFGSDLTTIAEAVAAVAAVVATGGAGAAILAVVAAAATMAADHAKELGIPPEVAMAIAVTASVAGLCCGDANGLFKVSAEVKDIAKDVELGAKVTGGVFKIEGAGFGTESKKLERDAAYFHADARSAQGQQDIASTDINDALDRLAAAVDHQNSAIKLTSSIQQQGVATNYAILSNWGGAA
jgi:phage shock protein PspC (stress-responsive transcriptional regulator)